MVVFDEPSVSQQYGDDDGNGHGVDDECLGFWVSGLTE